MNRHVNLDEKLAVLQGIDGHQKWYSLDDKRICALCEKLISGRMIDIWQDQSGAYILHCPTPGCSATPRDWHYCRLRASERPELPQEPGLDRQISFFETMAHNDLYEYPKRKELDGRSENSAH